MDNLSFGKSTDQLQARATSGTVSQPDSTFAKDSFQISAPSISLPKGGGAIRGMGEKFAANPVTGTGSMTVPIATSPGRSGFGPQLSLSYDSGAGNGPFGLGWNLSLPAITRKTDKGLPQYLDAQDSDVFLLSGAEDLVPEFEKDASGQWLIQNGKHVPYNKPRTVDGVTYQVCRYRPRIEGLFARIERWTSLVDLTDVHWRSISKDNILTLYGKDSNSRITDSENPAHIFSWLICETRDDKGNGILYEYKAEDGTGVDLLKAHERNRGDKADPRRTTNRYLKRIKYGNRTTLLDQNGQRPPLLTPTQQQNAGWMFEAVLDYGEHHAEVPKSDDTGLWTFRNDPFSSYRSGFEVRTTRLCQRVLMFHHIPDLPTGEPGYEGLVRSTDFDYSYESNPSDARNPIYSQLIAVTQNGYKKDGTGYLKRSMPPVEFEYTQPIVQDQVEAVDMDSLENLPVGVDGNTYQWTDLHGEGIPGILTEQAGTWLYKRNLSPIGTKPVEFSPLEMVALKPNLSITVGQAQFMDLAGDGQPDLVMLDGSLPGLYEHDLEEGWEPFRPFTARLNRNMQDPNLKFVDLDGDGHADVLITENEALVWHQSLGEEGFGPAKRVAQVLDEEKGPRVVFSDGTQAIYLSDMSGDGLTDIVRISNGEVCYWPNLGYGRFGAKISMDQAPWFDQPDYFDQKRIRLADIDGTGTTDIIYLHRDGVRLYFNQSGNAWSQPSILKVFPHLNEVDSIAPTDLLGNGTACLVWSSPLPGDSPRTMRYVNLMGKHKPHLLVKTVNNLGAETHVEYTSSIKFYLQDRRNGKPWITKLPFPVHVVERVETYDRISRNRFVTRYTYHHGYFDGVEREFRGFGRVDQIDTEEFAALTQSDHFPVGDNIDAASHIPPVLTKTWFHTGAHLDSDRVSNFFAGLMDDQDRGEYYRELGVSDVQAEKLLLDDTVLPDGLSLEEDREACRALKGSMLRQEIYALDGSEKQDHPYTVTEQNFTLKRVQPRENNRQAVFFAHPREALSYHYERNPTDPRVGHTLTLEVDDYGSVTKSLALGYGRRPGKSPLDEEDRKKQEQHLVTYTENDVTNSINDPIRYPDDYRAPMPSETRTYEVTGLTGDAGTGRLAFDILAHNGAQVLRELRQIPYEQPADYSKQQKRLIERVRTLYRKDDLSALLALRALEPKALPGESYKLAFTPGLLDQVYVRNGQKLVSNPADLLQGGGPDRGGYVDLDGDRHWWIPSGQIFYSPNPGDAPAQELAYARQHFFLPHRYRDPFHTNEVSTESFVTYDRYDLLVEETRDALGNRVTVGERNVDPTQPLVRRAQDYRILQPALVMDPNRNRSEVAFDTLGMVVGMAFMGKPLPEPIEGDSLEGFIGDVTPAQLDQFISEPRKAVPNTRNTEAAQIVHHLLSQATTRIVYDLDRFMRLGEPPFAVTIARETHVSNLKQNDRSKLQVSFSYSDGFGREIQKKIQAEPGPVPQRDANGKIIVGADAQPAMTPNDVGLRWVSSGWTIFNNKGKPVRQYEPFFTDTHCFEFDLKSGVSPVLFYDPVERVVATLHPNHTWEKVVFDPWRQETWDVNDTVLIADPRTDADAGNFFRRLSNADYLPTWHALRTDAAHAADFVVRYPDAADRTNETRAAEKAHVHAATPIIAHADTLGRTFLTVGHSKAKYSDPPAAAPPIEEFQLTRIVLDIEGNQREVIDAKDRVVMRYAYDILGNRLHQASMEAGARWMVNDVAGKPLAAWDSRNHRFSIAYDALRRPTHSYLLKGLAEALLVGQTIYGEGRTNPEGANLRGKAIQVFDQAGVVTTDEYDFKGNLLRSERQLAQWFDRTLDWSTPVPRETETYSSRTKFDALNRPTQLIAPHSDQPGTKINVIQPVYNEANFLENIAAWLSQTAEPSSLLDQSTATLHAVTDIDYDAKGQRKLITYGNGVTTIYEYDRFTFRLTRLKATRSSDNTILQDLSYIYDPAGNITHIQDDAQQTIYFKNQVVEPHNDYTYDALYRLIEATGREHLGQIGGTPIPHSFHDAPRVGIVTADAAGRFAPNDGGAMERYIERYRYDAVGNFLEMKHTGSNPANPGWTRNYRYKEASLLEPNKQSNRLSGTQVGNGTTVSPETYPYDAHGNMTSMPHLQVMQWDFKDQLQMTQRQKVNDQDGDGVAHHGERTWYVYDASGQRVRKVTELATGQIRDERIYLSGFEIYKKNGTISLVRETLHIMDDKQRVALVETRTRGNELGVAPQLTRYQFSNHLGSASLELDDQALIISYEEYAPYGSSTYYAVRIQTSMSKRYRYTGKERDEESGFYYHGARYYTSWLGRWTSCDPVGITDGINAFAYVGNRPISAIDSTGLADEGVTKIAQWLQAFVDTVPEDEWKQLSTVDPEWASTTPSSRGTRYHTVMEAAVALGWENKYGADIERVVSELHVDASGNLVAVNTPPGAANAYGTKRTADIGVLKEGATRSDIEARIKAGEKIKASDVLEITLDYKTGDASLKGKQAMEALSGVPYERLAKGGDLAGDVAAALKRVGNPIKASQLIPDLPGGKTLGKGAVVAGGALVLLKPVAAAAGPIGDVVEIGMGAKAVADAPPEQRAQVAKEETAGFAGGWAGSALAGLGVAALCSTGWGCLALGVAAVGGGGLVGDKLGRAAARSDSPTVPISRDDGTYYYFPGERINKRTGEFELRAGPKW